MKFRGTKPVIPNKSNCKQSFSFDKKTISSLTASRHAFCGKNFQRIATRYDGLALNYRAAVCLVAVIVWWISQLKILTRRFGGRLHLFGPHTTFGRKDHSQSSHHHQIALAHRGRVSRYAQEEHDREN